MSPPVTDQAQIHHLLVAVRRRLRLRAAASDGTLALAAGGGLCLVLVLAAGKLGANPAWRIVGLVGIGAALGGFAWQLLRPLLRWRDEAEVARAVDARARSGGLVLSAVELLRDLPRIEATSEASPALVRAAVAQAAARCRALRAGELVDLAPARRRLLLLLTVAAAYVVAFLALPERLGRGWQVIQKRPVPVETAPEPLIADLEVKVTYPAYMRLPQRTIPGASGDVVAPRGATVELAARALQPVRSAELSVEVEGKKAETTAAAVKDGRVEAKFVVAGAGGWRFTFRGPSGRAQREAEAHRIEIEPDRPPRVELRAPADDVEVTSPRARLQLAFSVEDDFGVGRIDLVWKADERERGSKDQKEHRVLVREAKSPAERTAQGTWEWDLSDAEMQPGQRLAYHLEARDNNDVTGPQTGSSRTFHVHLYSPKQKHEELLGREQELVEHAVALLADRIDVDLAGRRPVVTSAPLPGEDPTPVAAQAQPESGDARAEAERREGVHRKSEAFLAELGRVLGDLEKDALAPKDLRPALVEIHERLGKLVRVEEEIVHELRERYETDPPSGALKPLRDGNARHVSEMERDALLLDDLLNRQRLEQLISIADEMNRARDRLKDLLERYKKSKDPALKKEIERELRELERRLAELAEKASQLRGELPDEFINREALAGKDMGKELDKVRELLAKGDVDQALAELSKLSQSLDRMTQGLEQDLRGYRNERFSAEEKALAELESRLADLEEDERQIQKETDGVREKYQQEAARHLKDKVEPFLKQARAQAAEMKRRVNAVDPKLLPGMDQERLDHTRRDIEQLEEALAEGDLDQARELARSSLRGLSELNFSLYNEEQRQWMGTRQPVRKARGEVVEAQGIARKLSDELDQLMPRPDEMMSPSDRQRMGDLRDRQKAAARRLEDARRELEKRAQGQRAPGMSQMADDMMREAGGDMERASERLGEGEPQGASQAEGRAADRLGQLRQQIAQQRRPNQERMSGASGKDEVVKIPGADEYQGPREFRQDLLDAMKRGAPEEYKDRVKRYYEELAR